jgi:hypothetical protein
VLIKNVSEKFGQEPESLKFIFDGERVGGLLGRT